MTDWEIVEAMERYGGSFVQALAKAFQAADEENQRRIKATWPEYWKRYDDLAAEHAKRVAQETA